MVNNSDLQLALDTPLGHYEVIDAIYTGRPARLLYSGQRQAAQSGLALDDKPEQLFDYNERFMELLRGLLPRKVLLLGGGAFTLPKAINEELPDCIVHVVELDPELPKIAAEFFDFVPGKRTTIHIGDGARFLAESTEQYDLILLDVFTNTTIPPAFQTAETAYNLAARLREGGVVAMNIIASYYVPLSTLLRRQIAAFKPAFTNIELFPAGREPSLYYSQNFVLCAQNGRRQLAPYLLHPPLNLPITTD